MNDFLQEKLLDNSVQAYLIVLGAIILALIIKRFVSRYLAGLLYRLVISAGKKFNKKAFCDLVVGPLEVFLMVMVIIIAFDKLKYPGVLDFSIYHVRLSQLLEGLANGTMVVVFIWLCIRIIEFLALLLEEKAAITKNQTDNQLVVFFKDFFKVLLVIIGGLMILRFVFQQDIGNLLTGLSIVGAAIALATRESLENLIASFIIFFDKPFVTGDTVKVQHFTGTVEKIGLRSTRIRTVDKTYISVPNKQMVDSIVDNISLRTQRKAELRLEISLTASADALKKLLAGIKSVLQHPDVLKGDAHFTETGKNANIITIEYFSGMELTDDAFNDLKEAINFKIKQLVDDARLGYAAFNLQTVLRSQHEKE